MPIFTDGSRTGDEVGATTVFLKRLITHFLSPCSSLFTSQQMPMIFALFRIFALPENETYLIFSDSQRALFVFRLDYPEIL